MCPERDYDHHCSTLAFLTRDFDLASELLHQLSDQTHSQSSTDSERIFLSERFEERVSKEFGRHADSGIGHSEDCVRLFALVAVDIERDFDVTFRCVLQSVVDNIGAQSLPSTD